MQASRVARLIIQRAPRSPLASPSTLRTVVCQPRINGFQSRSYATSRVAEEVVEVEEAPNAYPTRTSDQRPKIYDGIAQSAFPAEVASVLMAPINPKEVEIKPDGLIYLPEIRYRRILNRAFGPGAWALLPISPPIVERTNLIRTYALYCHGRFVSEATGEQPFFEGVGSTATAAEAAKSNALVRCCKDLGIGSELWDPQYIMDWKKKYSVEVQCENQKTKDRRRLWRRQDRPPFDWPWKEVRSFANPTQPKMPLETGVDPLGLQLQMGVEEAPETNEAPAQPQQAQPTQQRPPQQYQQQQQFQQPTQQPIKPVKQAYQPAQPQQAVTPSTPVPPPAPAPKAQKAAAAAAPAPVVEQAPPAPAPVAEKKGKKAVKQPTTDGAPAWDLEANVHPTLKTYKAKKWRELLSDPKAMKYLQWAAGNLTGPGQQEAIGFLSFVAAHNGPQGVLQAYPGAQ